MAKKKTASVNFFNPNLMGAVALALALLSLFGLPTTLALLAIGLGGISVWKSFRTGQFQYLFLGMTAILIGLISIWNYTGQLLSISALY
jgi:hypothetical protein